MAILILSIIAVAFGRTTTVDFGRAWRFSRGNDPKYVPPTFPTNLDGHTCSSFQVTPVGRMGGVGFEGAGDCARGCAGFEDCWGYVYHNKSGGWWEEQCFIALDANDIKSCVDAKDKNVVGGWRDSVPSRPMYDRATEGFDDSAWEIVDAPHDYVIQGDWNENADESHGYMPRNGSGWYRKHFTIPSDWEGSVVRVVFSAVFQKAEIWLNGAFLTTHQLGYTPFELRLDNVPSFKFGAESVLAVRTVADYGSGHWYEGGGLWQNVQLVRSTSARFVRDGVFVPSESNGSVITASAEVVLDSGLQVSSEMVEVVFSLLDRSSGAVLATKTSDKVTLTSNGQLHQISTTLTPSTTLQLWSIQNPHLYTFQATLRNTQTSEIDDSVTFATGFRTTSWNADQPVFQLNNQPVHLRGFCDHDDTFGVGAAVPPRINLYRSQSLRVMGSSHRRFSHNPPDPALPNFMTRIGILTFSENRDYGLQDFVQYVTDFARRDRNQPSVMLWSVWYVDIIWEKEDFLRRFM